jgi:polyisoprenoid-binding protein YceI
MRLLSQLSIFCLCCLAGCAGDAAGTSSDDRASDPALAGRSTPANSEIGGDRDSAADQSDLRTVPLSPENTTIQFVGTHVTPDGGADPNARTGVFTEFAGEAQVDPATNSLQAVSVEIETKSLKTPIDRLNGHLATPDFFDVNQYPTARFASTEITTASEGDATHTIKGDLTLLKTTKEISFPATVRLEGDKVFLDATFVLDRTEFGINYDPNRVNKEVTMTVAIGKKTEPPQAQDGGRGRRRGGSRTDAESQPQSQPPTGDEAN